MDGSNSSGIHPVEFKVLVKPTEIENKTSGGIFLPDEVIERNSFARQDGIIIEASPMAFRFEEWPDDKPIPKAGDKVMFARYNADKVTGKDGVDYWIMNDKSIMAVVDY